MQLPNPYNKRLLSLGGVNPYNSALMSLAGFMDILGAASSAFGGGAGGAPTSAGMMPTTSVSVNPNINVNPQISPVFQQQFQPNNSPIAAGTSQGSPAGGGSGAGGGLPAGVSTPMIPNVPAIPIDWNKYLLYGGVGIAALVAIKMLSNNRRAPVRRRTSKRTK